MAMTREQAREAARPLIEEYLLRKGINPRKEFSCLNPAHTDTHPSMSLDRKHYRCVCFACGARYDVFDLVALDYGLSDQREIFDKTYEILRLSVENTPRRSTPEEDFSEMDGQKQDKSGQYTDVYTHTHTHKAEAQEENYLPYFETCKKRLPETGYPAERGLSAETLERHMIGYEPEFRTKDRDIRDRDVFVTWQALIIPTGRGSYVVRNTDPSASHKNRYRNRGTSQIFGYKALYSSASPVFVVEGEIDAMSIEEAGGAAVGLGSLDNVPLLLRLMEEKRPSQPIIIALDNEEKDNVKRAEDKLREGLERLNIPHYRLNPYGSYKDANEALVRDREAFSEAIRGAARIESQAEEEAREAYLMTSAGAHLQDFLNGISESASTEPIPTGLSELDNVLDGGLYEGLITIGAISSLGKTTFVMQLADYVAAGGNDVLVFSLEMARNQLMSKSISRHTLLICEAEGLDTRNAKTARGITRGSRYINYSRTELDLIQRAIMQYQTYADRIFIQEGIGDIGVSQIRETVERHILTTGGQWGVDEKTGERRLIGGRRPLVVVDYLQILAPYNDRMTDKQNTDKAILELKRISRDYKLPVLAISAFNRDNYKTAVGFEAFKESGAIEYSSDILLGLQLKGAGEKNFDSTVAKKKNPREVELVVLKNRDAAVGQKVSMEYYPMFNYFKVAGVS